jgi:hypothetical protein
MPRRQNTTRNAKPLSRRAFVSGVAVAAALAPNELTHADDAKTPVPVPSPAALIEAQAQAILGKHGQHLSAEQKADVKRLLSELPKTGTTLRSLPLSNSDEPAAVFHVHASKKG